MRVLKKICSVWVIGFFIAFTLSAQAEFKTSFLVCPPTGAELVAALTPNAACKNQGAIGFFATGVKIPMHIGQASGGCTNPEAQPFTDPAMNWVIEPKAPCYSAAIGNIQDTLESAGGANGRNLSATLYPANDNEPTVGMVLSPARAGLWDSKIAKCVASGEYVKCCRTGFEDKCS